jgi:hypothetical protein
MPESPARTGNRNSERLAAIDQLLLAGIKLGPAKKREAIDRVLELVPGWTRGDCWKRLRHLRKRYEHFSIEPHPITKAKKSSRSTQRSSCGPWTSADDETLLNLAGYEPVTRIAQRLSRSVPAVRFRLGSLGMSAKVTDGWSLGALRRMLHIRSSRLRDLIANGLLRVRDARITASSLAAYCDKNQVSLVGSNVETLASASATDGAAFTWERAAEALGIGLADVQRLVSVGQLKVVDAFVTDRAFEEFCRKHGDQVNMPLIDPAIAQWLISEYGVLRSADSMNSPSRWQKHALAMRECKCGLKIAGNVYFKHVKCCSRGR